MCGFIAESKVEGQRSKFQDQKSCFRYPTALQSDFFEQDFSESDFSIRSSGEENLF